LYPRVQNLQPCARRLRKKETCANEPAGLMKCCCKTGRSLNSELKKSSRSSCSKMRRCKAREVVRNAAYVVVRRSDA